MKREQATTRTLRALELLSAGPVATAELAEELGVDVRTARSILGRLTDAGYARRCAPSRKLTVYLASDGLTALGAAVRSADGR